MTDVPTTKQQDAIRKDVSKVDAVEEKDAIVTDVPKISQREMAMQSIISNRVRPVEEPEKELEELEGDLIEKPEIEKPIVEVDDEEILIIDGIETKVKKDKVYETGKRSLQKELAADKKLEQASIREQELKAREEELARMEQEFLKKRDQTPDDRGKKFADAMYTDEEQIAKTVSELYKELDQTKADVIAVKQAEIKRQKDAEAKIQAEQSKVVKHYQETYADISADPVMHFAQNAYFQQLQNENPGESLVKLVDDAAKMTYQKFNVNKTNSRQEAKEKMPGPIKKASARVEAPPEIKPKTPAQKIDEMRLGRGPRPY